MAKPLDRMEWDFSACPESELGACFNWEYLREILRLDPELAPQLLHPFIPHKLSAPGQTFRYSSDRRQWLCESLDERFPRDPYLILPHDLRDALQDLGSSVVYRIPVTDLHIKPPDPMPHTWGDKIGAGEAQILSLAINWNLSQDAIKKHFAEIIKTHPRPVTPRNRRGVGGPHALREKLKFLGARRIWKRAAGDPITARSEAALYDAQSAWEKASAKAGKVLEQFRTKTFKIR